MVEFKVYPRSKTIQEITEKHSFKILGIGAFAKVYSLGQAKVAKIGLVSKNKPYLDYIRSIMNQNNPYFPKVFRVSIFQNSEQDRNAYFVVVLEKLKPGNYNHGEYSFLMNHWKHLDDILEYMEMDETRKIHLEEFNTVMSQLLKKGYESDICGSNIMIQGERAVVTDPVFC